MVKYIQKVLPDFSEANVVSLYRVGKLKIHKRKKQFKPELEESEERETEEQNTEPDKRGPEAVKYKPRTAVVGLRSAEFIDLVLTRASDIRANSGSTQFWINRDQNDNSRRKHQMVRACYRLMLDRKYACSMKGSTITFQGKQYDYERLNLLPESCTPYYVKTHITEDGNGLCFASEHIFCSNLAPAKIKYGGKMYYSVEHTFQCIKVKDAGYEELAEEIRGIRNPYDVKRLGHSIPIKKKWKKKAGELMELLIQMKFDQNQKLKEKLMETCYRKYYEMTGDKLWATGRRVNKADTQIPFDSLTGGKNLVGKAIAKVKNGYILEEVRFGRREPDNLRCSQQEEESGSEGTSESSDASSDTIEVDDEDTTQIKE